MRSTRALILLTLALCGLSARAQYAYPAAGTPPQGMPQPMASGAAYGAASAGGPPASPSYGAQGTDVKAGLAQAGQGLTTGLQQAGQGLLQAGQGAVQATYQGAKTVAADVGSHVAQGFQDAANVAQFVGNAATTVNSAVAQGIKSIPETIKQDYANAQANIANDMQTFQSTAQALGQVAQAGVATLPPLTQAWNPAAWKQAYANSGQEFTNAYSALSSTLTAVEQGIEAKYCTPATFTPSTKKPAAFVGHSFSITFASPVCAFNEEAFFFNKTKELDCTKPSVVYVKKPASFTSKYKSAPKFVGKECILSKTFGEKLVKVLYVFNGTTSPTIQDLTGKVTSELKSILGEAQTTTSAVAGQVQNFMSNLPHLHGLHAMAPPAAVSGGPAVSGAPTVSGAPVAVPPPAVKPFDHLKQALASYPSMYSS